MFAQRDQVAAERPRRRGLWLLVAACSAVLVVVAAAVPVFGWAAQQSSTRTWTQQHAVSQVNVQLTSGDVSIVPGPAGMVSLVQTLTWVTERPTITESWSGDVLTVTESCDSSHDSPFGVGGCGAQLRLSVPASAMVGATADSGNVAVTGMSGAVHAEATSGDVILDGDSGYLGVYTRSGSVSGDRLRSPHVEATVLSGDLSLDFAAAPTIVNASVQSGDASVVVPAGTTYRVSGQTQSGDRSVEPRLVDDASNRSITLGTLSGDTSLGYPN